MQKCMNFTLPPSLYYSPSHNCSYKLFVNLFPFNLSTMSVGMSFCLQFLQISPLYFPVIYAWNVSCEIMLKFYYCLLQISSWDSPSLWHLQEIGISVLKLG